MLDDITAGLLDRSGNPIPLKDVHIKGRILDFVAQVIPYSTEDFVRVLFGLKNRQCSLLAKDKV